METWERDLIGLMRRAPTEDVKGTIQRIMKGALDDRSTALTCGAFAEIGLVAGIAMVMQPDQEQVMKWFWKPRAKFGTFKEKIKKAFALELIGRETKQNLEVVRAVRNVFAHSLADVRFTTPEIEKACELIKGLSDLPKEQASRKGRFAYCRVCDGVFRASLTHAALRWIMPAVVQQKVLLP
jgi:hypothetical protein